MANFYDFFSAPSSSHPFDDIFPFLFPQTRERHFHAEPELPRRAANRKHKHKHKSIPIQVDGPDTRTKVPAANRKHESIQIPVDGPDTKAKGQRRGDDLQASRAKTAAPAATIAVAAERHAPLSAKAAAVRLQAAARGFLARRSVKTVRKVERHAKRVERIVRQSEEEFRGNPSARIKTGEYLMGLLLRLDAVRRARDYRRRVIKKVVALQEAIDSLEPKALAEDQIAEESPAVAPVPTLQDAIEIKATPATPSDSEVAAEETDAAAPEATVAVESAEEAEAVPDDANPDDDKPDGSDADAEWEILKEEEDPVAPACQESPCHDPAVAEDAGAAGTVDTGKLMEMVAALCQQNAEQYALIHALTERVDALERTVRRA